MYGTRWPKPAIPLVVGASRHLAQRRLLYMSWVCIPHLAEFTVVFSYLCRPCAVITWAQSVPASQENTLVTEFSIRVLEAIFPELLSSQFPVRWCNTSLHGMLTILVKTCHEWHQTSQTWNSQSALFSTKPRFSEQRLCRDECLDALEDIAFTCRFVWPSCSSKPGNSAPCLHSLVAAPT